MPGQPWWAGKPSGQIKAIFKVLLCMIFWILFSCVFVPQEVQQMGFRTQRPSFYEREFTFFMVLLIMLQFGKSSLTLQTCCCTEALGKASLLMPAAHYSISVWFIICCLSQPCHLSVHKCAWYSKLSAKCLFWALLNYQRLLFNKCTSSFIVGRKDHLLIIVILYWERCT